MDERDQRHGVAPSATPRGGLAGNVGSRQLPDTAARSEKSISGGGVRGSRRVNPLVSASSKSEEALTRSGRLRGLRDSLAGKESARPIREPCGIEPRHPRHQEKITTGQPIRSLQALIAMARARGEDILKLYDSHYSNGWTAINPEIASSASGGLSTGAVVQLGRIRFPFGRGGDVDPTPGRRATHIGPIAVANRRLTRAEERGAA
ncbi:hypothetical protein CSOJ01_13871 [Colletotrichum sojae]|uniref:Uncharacterized protein n=1 Tax=Colletotrichum sojae TaxID=2175907 RepID=A0A8H6IRW6_9PEZI|nr:hypothetical protein CSOJ01_13871 [Colletotrichum sojae]